ncbi:hypothetical protein BFP72_02000 [Reichenbachiella sp. 5M10]|uniref:DinB family protein n=1 Tax=Reichenbachiella sp. 5M10 TaxID=1889772 RepID=UPI000C14D31C|nr:DinB family protein [Reichenbachiella sp. 5M10]PIB34289.1 hypothetical protein BFP72_02000 [Reichenbachiella sp. 5M10]
MKRSELLQALTADTLQIIEEVKVFEAYEEEVLTRRSNPNKWSVVECLEHLNIADAHYLLLFDQKLPNGLVSEEVEYKSSWVGSYFVKSMKPRTDGTIPSPMRTLRKFDPEVVVHQDTLSKFLEDQHELLRYLEMCHSLDLKRIKIPSAIGRIVTFRLGDALRFLVAHNQRHVIQAKNVLRELGV